jgi:ubiquinol-cytochrome c reductase cytochrome b subunit/menaquinol-cytochrome c reductase cytochrome b/c subunit
MAVVPREKPRPIDERRAEFKRYKDDVQKRGKPFYPYAMFHDTVMSLIVVLVIMALATIWKWTSWAPSHDGTHQGLLGPEYTAPADPGTTNFVPRPDWYFYFLFYLLRIFKWPESVFLGTVGVPTIALLLLIGLPFYDVSRKRRPLQRPLALVGMGLVVISMATLTWKGATASEALASEVIADVPNWVKEQNLPANAVPGAKLFAVAGCTACHTYLGTGSSNLGAPDLTAIGSRNLGIQFQINHLKCPSCVNPGSPMPKFESLGEKRLRQLAIFLEASKGRQ